MKRLRKRIGTKVRFFMCGEYGENFGRPHYHYLIFGYSFPDKKFWKKEQGNDYFRSPELEAVWDKGHSLIGAVTYETAAYVAGYIFDKMKGEKAESHYQKIVPETGELIPILPEFCKMSLKPGIGQTWFEKFGQTDIKDGKDFVTVAGKKYKIPRYYDEQQKALDEKTLRRRKRIRAKRAYRYRHDSTDQRLEERERVTKARLNLKEKTL